MSLTTNIVSYWKLDDASGNAADSVGSNPLTNNNTITYANTNPLINNYAHFVSASSQWFTVPSFTISAAFSISFWIKRATTGNYQGFWTNGTGSGSSNTIEIATVNDDKIHYSNFNTEIITSATLTSTSTWYHVVVTQDGSGNAIVYVNGSSSATGTVTHAGTTDSYDIGRVHYNTAEYYNGNMDEIGLWSRVLTSSEVTQLYNGGAGLQYPFTPPATKTGNFLMFF